MFVFAANTPPFPPFGLANSFHGNHTSLDRNVNEINNVRDRDQVSAPLSFSVEISNNLSLRSSSLHSSPVVFTPRTVLNIELAEVRLEENYRRGHLPIGEKAWDRKRIRPLVIKEELEDQSNSTVGYEVPVIFHS